MHVNGNEVQRKTAQRKIPRFWEAHYLGNGKLEWNGKNQIKVNPMDLFLEYFWTRIASGILLNTSSKAL